MSVDPRVIRGVVGKAKLVLTERQFRYFQLYYENGMAVVEIARQERRNPATVYKILKVARNRMRNEWR